MTCNEVSGGDYYRNNSASLSMMRCSADDTWLCKYQLYVVFHIFDLQQTTISRYFRNLPKSFLL
eukprot:6480026-Amphidinium_carterae.1